MKSKRHNKIIEIITRYDIDTQDELIAKLRESGFDVTQATVSRDIRDLKLVKISTEDHRYKYALSPHDDIHISVKYRNIMRETIIHVDYANNFVVLRTYSGMAQAAAAAVDGMGWNEIVGTIAGDDTIFVLMRDNAAAIEFSERLKLIGRGQDK
ncbi:MAG: arginine repressor [Ruminococcaceae bacterium]|nr:arginine repressor [Oscillospiraceae bacterium]